MVITGQEELIRPEILIDPKKCIDVPGKPSHLYVFDPEFFKRGGFVKFPSVRGCLPAVLYRTASDKQPLAIHTSVMWDPLNSSTIEEVTEHIKAHLQKYGLDDSWSLAVAERRPNDHKKQEELDQMPNRTELLAFFRTIQQTLTNVTPKVSSIPTSRVSDDLAFSPQTGFIRLI